MEGIGIFGFRFRAVFLGRAVTGSLLSIGSPGRTRTSDTVVNPDKIGTLPAGVDERLNSISAFPAFYLPFSQDSLRPGRISFEVHERPWSVETFCSFGAIVQRIIVLGKPSLQIIGVSDVKLSIGLRFEDVDVERHSEDRLA